KANGLGTSMPSHGKRFGLSNDLVFGCGDASHEAPCLLSQARGGVRKIKTTAAFTNVPAGVPPWETEVGSQTPIPNSQVGPFGCTAIQARNSGSEGCSRFQMSLCSPLRNATAMNPHTIATRLPFSLPRVLVSIPTRKTPRSEP